MELIPSRETRYANNVTGGSVSEAEAHDVKAQNKISLRFISLSLFLFFLSIFLFCALAADAHWQPLKERLLADGFEEDYLSVLFSRPEAKYDPKVMAGKISPILKHRRKMPAVSGLLNHKGVHKKFLRYRVINRARSYLMKNRDTLKEASASYCVPAEVIVSILLVETHLGRNTGRNNVFNRLASMANSADLDTIKPYLGKTLNSANKDYACILCRQKADWAYNELKALLDYARAKGVDPLSIKGSIYGAIGLCQFMPSNLFSFGIDADNDGQVDPFFAHDAMHSIANYLNKHGWECNANREGKRRAVYAYNNSTVYVNTVLAVADKLSGGIYAKK